MADVVTVLFLAPWVLTTLALVAAARDWWHGEGTDDSGPW